ncbi:MAG: Gfo/Idh/MocA family oxidoreductase [Ruminococcaceae bacterium]|nr:Gfo/Idh/MocA family oxidoreductase [Oscillospiraceae bacterium]
MKKLRFGIVGTGGIAHRFAEAVKNVPEAELTAVASRKKETADIFGDEFSVPYRFGSYEEMAQSDVIDCAYIATPHSCHKDCTILMLKGKKHVICEKPMAVTEKEAREMFGCAEENGCFLMEAMWARLVPGTIKLIEIINDGLIGEVRGIEGKFCYSFDEDEMDHHALKPENGGGSLLDVGVYALNFSKWYLGEETEEILSQCDFYNGTDSHTNILIKYKNGALASLSSATLLRKPNEGYIYGTKGFIHVNRFYAPQEIEIRLSDGRNETVSVPYKGNGFEEQISHMCSCINNSLLKSPVNTPENTLFIMKQMDLIRQKLGVTYPQDDD